MKKEDYLYLNLILFHVGIGFAIFVFPFLAKIYGYSIFIVGTIIVLKKQNKGNEALIAAAYVVGSEAFLRMTGGNPLYEISKYGVMYFVFIGISFSGFSKSAIVYWVFLLLLLPSTIMSSFVLSFEIDIRKAIIFNLSGPVCLAMVSLYTFRRKITFNEMNSILLGIGLPIISCVVYLIFYTPNVRDVIRGTGSNFATSGGFGPNQVATILGLGMFVFFSRILLASKTKYQMIINLIVVLNISYRGMVTFSRGGMITGFAMIMLLLLFIYLKSNSGGKTKLVYLITLLIGTMISVWLYTSFQTGGLIEKRYANQDARGREKKTQFTGREELAEIEINAFVNNPIFGIGVGKGVDLRQEELGHRVASHNEVTRMLGEHGLFGILGLLLLMITPMLLYFENKFSIYLLSFVAFWFLTINHAAMRLAAPAFVYGLSLLNVILEEKSVEKLE